jgi:hypothetical protein
MGAWGTAVFDNDDAADFSGEISDLTSLAEVAERLGSALDDVLGNEGYLDNYEANRGVAAAALTAAWNRPELLPRTPYEPDKWPAFDQPLPGALRTKAAQVIDRVLRPDENEFYDLWADAGSWDTVVADIHRYRSALP